MKHTVYFEAGPSNTDAVMEAVKERVQHRDIKAVVVPVTTGKTVALFLGGSLPSRLPLSSAWFAVSC